MYLIIGLTGTYISYYCFDWYLYILLLFGLVPVSYYWFDWYLYILLMF